MTKQPDVKFVPPTADQTAKIATLRSRIEVAEIQRKEIFTVGLLEAKGYLDLLTAQQAAAGKGCGLMTTEEQAALENFEKAFRGGVNGCRRTCECGIEYWDAHNEGYSWDEGEVEALMANPNARPLDYAVGVVVFEGRYYVDGCSCWHDRAKRISQWLDAHAASIAEYLTLEKQRKQRDTDRSPVVSEGR